MLQISAIVDSEMCQSHAIDSWGTHFKSDWLNLNWPAAVVNMEISLKHKIDTWPKMEHAVTCFCSYEGDWRVANFQKLWGIHFFEVNTLDDLNYLIAQWALNHLWRCIENWISHLGSNDMQILVVWKKMYWNCYFIYRN